MKEQSTENRVRKTGHREQVFFMCLLFSVFCLLDFPVIASEKWPGVDETVVEKVAEEHGRKASVPLINTDQGDLLLFLFLLGGAVGGFLAGYCWKTIITKRK